MSILLAALRCDTLNKSMALIVLMHDFFFSLTPLNFSVQKLMVPNKEDIGLNSRVFLYYSDYVTVWHQVVIMLALPLLGFAFPCNFQLISHFQKWMTRQCFDCTELNVRLSICFNSVKANKESKHGTWIPSLYHRVLLKVCNKKKRFMINIPLHVCKIHQTGFYGIIQDTTVPYKTISDHTRP